LAEQSLNDPVRQTDFLVVPLLWFSQDLARYSLKGLQLIAPDAVCSIANDECVITQPKIGRLLYIFRKLKKYGSN
jgi:hypothetical protein